MKTKNPFEPNPTKSRRGGPSKKPLSRDAIVREALALLSSDGFSGMSLRKVAAALDTGPASLYAYITDLSELHALVLDQALSKVELYSTETGWRERLQKILESYARVLAESPGLAQLAFGTVAVGPNALRIMETLLAILEEGGVGLSTSAWAVDLLTLYVTAIIAEHTDGHNHATPEGPVARAIAGASAREYPLIHAARAQLISGTGEERFAWAIEVLLQGILRTPRRPEPGPATNTTPKKLRRSR